MVVFTLSASEKVGTAARKSSRKANFVIIVPVVP
jgi:hypothetical protein